MRTSAIVAAAAIVSCAPTGPAPTHTSFPACEDIAVACHNLDLVTDAGDAELCHRIGHLSTDEASCAAKHDYCVAYCESDGGVDGSFEGGLTK